MGNLNFLSVLLLFVITKGSNRLSFVFFFTTLFLPQYFPNIQFFCLAGCPVCFDVFVICMLTVKSNISSRNLYDVDTAILGLARVMSTLIVLFWVMLSLRLWGVPFYGFSYCIFITAYPVRGWDNCHRFLSKLTQTSNIFLYFVA